MTSTVHVRRFRQRQRQGEIVLRVPVNQVDHCEMLISAGYLQAWDEPHDRAAIEEATARLLRFLQEQSEIDSR